MSAPETYGDIYCKIVAMFPNAIVDEGDQGELVIHTNLFPVPGDGDCYEDRPTGIIDPTCRR